MLKRGYYLLIARFTDCFQSELTAKNTLKYELHYAWVGRYTHLSPTAIALSHVFGFA
jgi:hypothetical protein